MANALRTRQRVTVPRCAPNGSTFIKCDRCSILVVVVMLDMHGCDGMKTKLKKSMGGKVRLWVRKTSLVVKSGLKKKRSGIIVVGIQDQPRSAFRCFMESFKKICKADNWLEIDMEGFNVWKKMSREERGQYVIEAEKVNSAYDKILRQEMEDLQQDMEDMSELDAHIGGVNDIAFSHPNKSLSIITCGDDKTIKVWDATSGQRLYVFKGHESPVYSVCPHYKEAIQFIF